MLHGKVELALIHKSGDLPVTLFHDSYGDIRVVGELFVLSVQSTSESGAFLKEGAFLIT